MLSIITHVGVQVVVQLLIAHMNNVFPSNPEIYQKLSTPECVLQRRWEHKRSEHFGFGNDPRYDDPRQRSGQMLIFQGPHQRIARAIEVMSQCRRFEILYAMITNGFIPGRVWDQPEPPKETSCTLQRVYARLWNVQDSASLLVNDVQFLGIKRGYSIHQKLQLWEQFVHVPNATPADTAWHEVSSGLLHPGLNTFQVRVSNVQIPRGFLPATPGPRTVNAQYVKDYLNPGPHGQFVTQPNPPNVGFLYLNRDTVQVDVVCWDSAPLPPSASSTSTIPAPQGPPPPLHTVPQGPPGLPLPARCESDRHVC